MMSVSDVQEKTAQVSHANYPKSTKDYALFYASKGWRVLICYTIKDGACSCGNECKSPGKHPMTAYGVSDATIDVDIINQWFTLHPDANIGIATGPESGFFAVDVDTNHGKGKYGDVSLEQLEKDHGKLPDDVVAITGSGGNHYLYQYPSALEIPCSTGKLGASIDVRGAGGYIIVEPSIHISGHAYAWDSESDPVFAGALIPLAPQWLLNLLTCKKQDMQPSTTSGMYIQSSEWDVLSDDKKADILDAMAHCPNYERDSWLEIGMSIHSMDSTETGLDIWSQWSSTCSKFDPQDQARVWASFNNGKSSKRNQESIFWIARKNGWKSSAEQQKIIEREQIGNAITDEINNKKTYEIPLDTSSKPIPVLFPVPVLNELAQLINSSAPCYSVAATTQAVISVLSLLASRRYIAPSGDSCHIYAGISSAGVGSVGELRYTSRAIRQILQQCGLRRMTREGRISSSQSLYKTLYLSPASLYLCDDYSAMIKLCTRQTTGGMEVVLNNITRLYDEKFVQLDSPQDADLRQADLIDSDGKPMIYRPCLSMLSLMHHSHLATFAKASELGRGAVEQFLFVICEEDDLIINKDEQDLVLPLHMMNKLITIRGLLSRKEGDLALNEILSECAGIMPMQIPVRFEGSLDKYDAMIDAVTTERHQRTFKQLARKNMRRLMTIMAAANNPLVPVATIEIMEWSAEYVVGHLSRLLDVLHVVVSDEGKLDIGQQVLDVILRMGAEGITQGKIVNYCRSYKALSKDKRQELIDKMKEDGDINQLRIKIAGQSSDRLIHSKFNQLIESSK